MDKRAEFRNCIAYAAAGYALSDDNIAVVRDTVQAYPWFTTARIILDEDNDTALRLHYSAYGRRSEALKKISPEEFETRSAAAGDAKPVRKPTLRSEEIIDKFLNRGEYRIVPDAAAPDHDAAANCADFDLTSDLVSEELAQIYLAQGLNNRAKKIYERLSLLNPEKSVYFAEIIEGIGNQPSVKK